MYIQLKAMKHIDVKGVTRTFHPGDWIDVGKQTARLWLAAGEAWIPPASRLELLPADCAILTRGEGSPPHVEGITVEPFDPGNPLAHGHNLIYTLGAPLRIDLLQVGFNLLGKWDAVAPLWSYKDTALRLGTEPDREATKEAIFDLRVPAYDTRLLFVRRNESGQALMAAWGAELVRPDLTKHDERLAFLRALFQVKPRICAAPVTWVSKDYDK